MKLHELVEGVQTREDLVGFLEALRGELRSGPDDWENRQLPDYLEALQAVTGSLDAIFANDGSKLAKQPTWQMLARMLYAAAYYE